MKKYLRSALIFGCLGIVLVLTGAAFAFFDYTKMGDNNELLAGNIYFNHTQGNTLSLEGEFTATTTEARARNDNVINLSITGLNESTSDIYYKFLLSHGDDITGRNRIDDKYLRFDLVEILPNNEEKYILYAESFDNIGNTIILKDRVLAGTTSNITRNYKLRMWVTDDIVISDTDLNADYTTSQYGNLFASVKITALGNIPEVYYYSTFDSAIAAVNNESIESNNSRSGATVGLYKDLDDGGTNLVLYSDVNLEQDYNVSESVNINLYGHTINLLKRENVNGLSLNFTDYVVLENGIIDVEEVGNADYNFGIRMFGPSAVINNITLPATDHIGHYIGGYSNANIIIKNSDFKDFEVDSSFGSNVELRNTKIDGHVILYSNAKLELNDSEIKWTSLDRIRSKKTLIYIFDSDSKLIVNNSTIFADSPGCYVDSNDTYLYCSVGIENSGTVIVNSGYIFGTHSAIEASGGSKTYVYGGTFESTDHGGFYLFHGSTGVAYIENATIRGISYPSQGIFRPNGTAQEHITYNNVTYSLEEVKTAFYLSGDTNQNNEKLYIANSTISSASDYVFVMRYSTPRQELYMSGCTLSSGGNNPVIRIDYPNTMKLYSGNNNNFTNITQMRNSNSEYFPLTTAIQNGWIIETHANYKGSESPNN